MAAPTNFSKEQDEYLTKTDRQIIAKLVEDWQEAFEDDFELEDNIEFFLYDNAVGFLQGGQYISPFEEEPLNEREIEVLTKLDALISSDKIDAMGPIPR